MPTTATDVTVRELPPEEWSRLASYEPFASGGIPPAAHWRIVVAEEAGVLVGFTCLYEAVHLEPVWIAPSHRHQPGLFAGLWRESRRILDANGVQMIFAVVGDHLPQQQALVERFGFTPAPGRLYLCDVTQTVIKE